MIVQEDTLAGIPARHDATARTRAAFEVGKSQARLGWPTIEPATWQRAEIEAYRAGRRVGAELRRIAQTHAA